MEILNISLWFTLVWWVICLWAEVDAFLKLDDRARKTRKMNVSEFVLLTTIVPAIAILLEYLIVRG